MSDSGNSTAPQRTDDVQGVRAPENPPAFSSLQRGEVWRDADGHNQMIFESAAGMTLRDYFAAAATQSDMQRWVDIMAENDSPCTAEEAKYLFADAMLRARA